MSYWQIVKKSTGRIMTEGELALEMYRNGQHIIYCDIEGITKIEDSFQILDECGNWAYIDTGKYDLTEISEEKYIELCNLMRFKKGNQKLNIKELQAKETLLPYIAKRKGGAL